MHELTFDLQDTSVSVPGSLFTITGLGDRTPFYRRGNATYGVYLRFIRSRDLPNFIFRLVPTAGGTPLENPVWIGAPGKAEVRHGEDWLSLTFTSPTEIVVEGQGLGLHLEGFPGYFDWIWSPEAGRWRYTASSQQLILDVVHCEGELSVDAPWEVLHSTHVRIEAQAGGNRPWRLRLCERPLDEPSRDTPAPKNWDAATDFTQWAEPLIAELPDRHTALLAAHTLWAHIMRPDGLLPGTGVIAGKAWMPSVYGWDQCFCAVGLAPAHPDLAWEQLALFFYAQAESGAIPSYMNADKRGWTTTMPPVQGWCLRQLRRVPGCVTPERLAWILPRLEAYVRWWLRRDTDGDGIPEYMHGNDSGWDNTTCFDAGPALISPDLLAYLSECCLALAEAAETLGDQARADQWQQEYERIIRYAITHLVENDRLIARRSPSGDVAPGDSLLPLIGLRFGLRLPEAVRASSITALSDEQRFLAPYGLATEALSSPFLNPDGYWRGAVWAPSCWLLAEALEEVGAPALARDVLARFCQACANDGMAENFHPLTGEGLRDRSYSWTAAVYLMAQRYLHLGHPMLPIEVR